MGPGHAAAARRPLPQLREDLQGLATLLGDAQQKKWCSGNHNRCRQRPAGATDIAGDIGTAASETLGPLATTSGGNRFGQGSNPRRTVSDSTAEIDKKRAWWTAAMKLEILHHNRGLLEDIAKRILEEEVIEGDELKELLSRSVDPQPVAAWCSRNSSDH